MKKIHLIFAALIITFGSFTFTNCKNDAEKANPLADSLKNENSELSSQLNDKEAALQEFIESFNEIQDNLNQIKEKEKIVTASAQKGDVKSRQTQIQEDIQAIYDLMEKNRNRIGSLTSKLKQSNLKISGLEKMIENLQNTITERDNEIADLKTKLEGLNVELSNLNTNYKNLESENNQRHEALNTAYYAIGTSKELKEKNVISKEGGFIGLGKSTKVAEDFNKEYFTKVNTEQLTTINIGAKKVKLLTSHPSGSYKFIGEKPVEKLEITNAADFWSASKYLVIVIE